MARKTKISFPSKDCDVPAFGTNVHTQLTTGGLAAKYGIVAGDVTKVQAFNTSITQKLNQSEQKQQEAQQASEQKDSEIYNYKLFLNKMGRDIQDHTSFDPADLEALGFTVISAPVDPTTAQPVISKSTVLPDKIILDWIKGSFQGVEVYGSFNGTTWVTLGRDFRSPYEDIHPNQVANTPEIRYYKMRYLLNDAVIGLESLVVKVLADI